MATNDPNVAHVEIFAGEAVKTKICTHCRSDEENDDTGSFVNPCQCIGSLAYMHSNCLSSWVNNSGKTTCDICKTEYQGLKTTYALRLPHFVERFVQIVKLAFQVGLILIACLISSLVWHWIANIPVIVTNNTYPPLLLSFPNHRLSLIVCSKLWHHLVGGVYITSLQWVLVHHGSSMIRNAMRYSELIERIHVANMASPNKPVRLLNKQELDWVLNNAQPLEHLKLETWAVWIAACHRSADNLVDVDQNGVDLDHHLPQTFKSQVQIQIGNFLSFLMIGNFSGLIIGFLPFVFGKFVLFMANIYPGDPTETRIDVVVTWIVGSLMVWLTLALSVSKHGPLKALCKMVFHKVFSLILAAMPLTMIVMMINYYSKYAQLNRGTSQLTRPTFAIENSFVAATCPNLNQSVFYHLFTIIIFCCIAAMYVLHYLHQAYWRMMVNKFNDILVVSGFQHLSDVWQQWYSVVHESASAGLLSYQSIVVRNIASLGFSTLPFFCLWILSNLINVHALMDYLIIILYDHQHTPSISQVFSIFIYCCIVLNMTGASDHKPRFHRFEKRLLRYSISIFRQMVSLVVSSATHESTQHDNLASETKMWFYKTLIFGLHACGLISIALFMLGLMTLGLIATFMAQHVASLLVRKDIDGADLALVNFVVICFLVTEIIPKLLHRAMDILISLYKMFAQLVHQSTEGKFDIAALNSHGCIALINAMCWGVIPYLTGWLVYSLIVDHIIIWTNLQNALSPFSPFITHYSVGFLFWNSLAEISDFSQMLLWRDLIRLKFGDTKRLQALDDGVHNTFDQKLHYFQLLMSFIMILVIGSMCFVYSFIPPSTWRLVSANYDFPFVFLGYLLAPHLFIGVKNILPGLWDRQVIIAPE
jgi:hypothetical protein